MSSGFSPLKTLLHAAYDRLDYLHQHKGEISGIRTGFADLDAMTTGLQKSDLIILAARPSIGKTSLALNFAEHAAVREGKTVGVFSLEMSKEQLVLRLLSSVANIDSQRLRTGFLEEMDFTRLAPAMNALAEAPIYIDDTPNISTMELRTKARRLQAESGLDMLIVDYLQLMQSSIQSRDANRVQEVSEISRGLKALARELEVPVVALSPALAPGGDARVKEPRLSDLARVGLDRAGLATWSCSCGARRSAAPTTRRPTARSSTCGWPSTATAPPARPSSGSGSARRASCPTRRRPGMPPGPTPRKRARAGHLRSLSLPARVRPHGVLTRSTPTCGDRADGGGVSSSDRA